MSESIPPKRPRGRPRVRPENPVNIRCELTRDEHAEVKEAADATGKTIGKFASEAAVEAARKVTKKPRKGKKA